MFQGIATRIAKKAAADVAAPFIRKEMRALGRESTLRATLMLSAATLIVAGASYTPTTHSEDDGEHREEMENWSGTHRVRPVAILRPESAEEVAAIVASSQNRGLKLRVVGNALSPNGIGFSDGIMLSMALCDQVLEVDPLRGTVRVEAGARVQQVVEALQAYE
jgi:FAD/FMN-containing dehydrogenase